MKTAVELLSKRFNACRIGNATVQFTGIQRLYYEGVDGSKTQAHRYHFTHDGMLSFYDLEMLSVFANKVARGHLSGPGLHMSNKSGYLSFTG